MLLAVKIFLSISLSCKKGTKSSLFIKNFSIYENELEIEDLGQCLSYHARELVRYVLVTLTINSNEVLQQVGNILTLVFTLSISSLTYHKETDVHLFLS